MAIRDKTVTIGRSKIKRLHLAVAKKCTVEIKEASGNIILSRRLNGVRLDFADDNSFTGLKTGQTIPWGTIRAEGEEDIRVVYRVRTGQDVTGAPEFPLAREGVSRK